MGTDATQRNRGLMLIDGALAQEVITDETFTTVDIAGDDLEMLPLDELFTAFDNHVAAGELLEVRLQVAGGVEAAGLTVTLLVNAVGLPLRYKNQLKKLIWPDRELELHVYAVVEHADVSQSQLKMTPIATVDTYRDDPESAKAKIAHFIDTCLAEIQAHQAAAEATNAEKPTQ